MEDQIPLSKTTERSGSTIIQTGKMKSPNNKLLTRFFLDRNTDPSSGVDLTHCSRNIA